MAKREDLLLAKQLAREIVREVVAIVFGPASDIDTTTHLAVLESGGTKIAVIGSRFAESNPPGNVPLRDIVADAQCVEARRAIRRGHLRCLSTCASVDGSV